MIMIDLQSLSELIEFRRTVKPIDAIGQPNYSERSVSRETIQQILRKGGNTDVYLGPA